MRCGRVRLLGGCAPRRSQCADTVCNAALTRRYRRMSDAVECGHQRNAMPMLAFQYDAPESSARVKSLPSPMLLMSNVLVSSPWVLYTGGRPGSPSSFQTTP